MVLAGYGIGFFPKKIGEKVSGVKKVKDLGDIGKLPIWLTAHSELKQSQKLRLIYDFLAEYLEADYLEN